MNPEKKVEAFLMILGSLGSKTNYKKLSIFYPENYLEKGFITDYIFELFLVSVNSLLNNNQKLKEFNVLLEFPEKHILKYSSILLDAIKRNKNLEKVNFINFNEIKSDNEKAFNLACNYFCLKDSFKKDTEFHSYTHIIISEFIKENNPLVAKKLIRLFEKYNFLNNKTLNFFKPNNNTGLHNTYKYNYIEVFSSLEILIISDNIITSEEIDTIEKNIQNLEFLHTIKLKNNIFKDNEISGFLGARNLINLKISDCILKITDFTRFSTKIKSSNIEKITLKNILLQEKNKNGYFEHLIESITCNSLKTLKIYISYTPYLLYLLFRGLYLFKNLEFICVFIEENFEKYESCIKGLISIVHNNLPKAIKFKMHKYIWDIENFKRKKRLEFIRCQLCPVDLIILAELCEEKIIESVKCVDLSENLEIVDNNFVKNITRIIKPLKCNEVILKNCECKQKHIKEIKRLLDDEISFYITK
ncbi:hypothetical protein SteCoe_38387 [Stentor coeruleus]|uniref:Uncharacterized protein n=1 Tax=Stentor coeruleus TaxID=5963 RepID=A0A1R2ALH7_9CILI|nr:hypothetical protein SteCoe_38387 [Stentor coeruleus]